MASDTTSSPVTHEDVQRGARLLLDRAAGAQLDAHLGGDWSALAADLVASPAFVRRLVDPALIATPFPPGLDDPLDAETGAWTVRRLGGPSSTAREAIAGLLDRLAKEDEAGRARLWRYVADRLRAGDPALAAGPSPMRLVFAEALRDASDAEADHALRRLDQWSVDEAKLHRAALARREEALLAPADAFDPQLYFDGGPEPAAREEAIRVYLSHTPLTDFNRAAAPGEAMRRPLPGFHPLCYAQRAPDFPRAGDRNPLAHFIERGRPSGPWTHEVIRLSDLPPPSAPSPLSVALHGHFHYVDHIEDFLQALAVNSARVDLFLTTTGEAQAERLREAVRGYAGGDITVEVGPNLGRDIAPFIRVLQTHVLGRYDVVGHLHGKRSLEASERDEGEGERWRDFLWRHLLGPDLPVLDLLLERLTADPGLGLVFPEHAVAMGWDRNAAIAREIAPRLGLAGVPEHIEFPVGSMFWARPEALRPLVDAGFGLQDFPPEPAPRDGSLLHALERMFALMAEHSGYRYAATYRPEVTR